jgi:hypothetical protein
MTDRIADLDARFARGEVSKAAYERYRECLMTLAGEELQGTPSAAGRQGGDR